MRRRAAQLARPLERNLAVETTARSSQLARIAALDAPDKGKHVPCSKEEVAKNVTLSQARGRHVCRLPRQDRLPLIHLVLLNVPGQKDGLC